MFFHSHIAAVVCLLLVGEIVDWLLPGLAPDRGHPVVALDGRIQVFVVGVWGERVLTWKQPSSWHWWG